MDPLSVTASIVGILAAAGKLTELLHGIISTAKDAPQVVTALLCETRDVQAALSSLQSLLVDLSASPPRRTALIQIDQLIVTLTESVLTFSELEAIITPLAALTAPKFTIRTRLRWTRAEGNCTKIVERLQRHKASISLMLNILQCASDTEASRSQGQLTVMVDQLLHYNQQLSKRMKNLEDAYDARSTITKKFDGLSFISQDDNQTIRTARSSINDRPSILEAVGVRFTFDRDLESSRVYRMARNDLCDASFISSAMRTNAWSIFSGLSLADISVISVVALPIYPGEIEHQQYYTFSEDHASKPETTAFWTHGQAVVDIEDVRPQISVADYYREIVAGPSSTNGPAWIESGRPADGTFHINLPVSEEDMTPPPPTPRHPDHYKVEFQETVSRQEAGDQTQSSRVDPPTDVDDQSNKTISHAHSDESEAVWINVDALRKLNNVESSDPVVDRDGDSKDSVSKQREGVGNIDAIVGNNGTYTDTIHYDDDGDHNGNDHDGDFETEYCTYCTACNEILGEGKAFELAGRRWHIDCFKCNTCEEKLDSDSNLLLLGDGSLICNNCTYSCTVCNKKIEDLAVLTEDAAYCKKCFACANCKKVIDNYKYARTSQGIFCRPCWEGVTARRNKQAREKSEENADEPEPEPSTPTESHKSVSPTPSQPSLMSSSSSSFSCITCGSVADSPKGFLQLIDSTYICRRAACIPMG